MKGPIVWLYPSKRFEGRADKKDVESMEEENSLRIEQEDILRILSERGGEVSLESIKADIPSPSIGLAVKDLLDRNLVRIEGRRLIIAKEGKEKSKNILRKHRAVEKHFEKTKTREEAHKAAHLLEHQISLDVIENMEKISSLRNKSVSLTGSGLKEGLITDILLKGKLFERIISMGICPGKKGRVQNELPNVIIVETDGKKLALEKEIANRIEFVTK